jgi:hypothetical protein
MNAPLYISFILNVGKTGIVSEFKMSGAISLATPSYTAPSGVSNDLTNFRIVIY